jgi:hypothetical protein
MADAKPWLYEALETLDELEKVVGTKTDPNDPDVRRYTAQVFALSNVSLQQIREYHAYVRKVDD